MTFEADYLLLSCNNYVSNRLVSPCLLVSPLPPNNLDALNLLYYFAKYVLLIFEI
jgi:hypothetical protein